MTQALELSTWVHPRSRGEYARKQSDCVRSAGSSPLTRGILSVFFLAVHTPGFIPAHAGNTGRQALPSGRLQVHPRSRGEYSACLTSCHAFIGSPPLTRGIQTGENFEYTSSRFTPAHAGNTRLFFLKSCLPEVHPRSRGEYNFLPASTAPLSGSPPLTRGIPSEYIGFPCPIRFTPAHAGNTQRKKIRNASGKVHPRSRGEYYLEEGKSNQGLGSPQLTRGIHGKSGDGTNPAWFTPAHAGNTCH